MSDSSRRNFVQLLFASLLCLFGKRDPCGDSLGADSSEVKKYQEPLTSPSHECEHPFGFRTFDSRGVHLNTYSYPQEGKFNERE